MYISMFCCFYFGHGTNMNRIDLTDRWYWDIGVDLCDTIVYIWRCSRPQIYTTCMPSGSALLQSINQQLIIEIFCQVKCLNYYLPVGLLHINRFISIACLGRFLINFIYRVHMQLPLILSGAWPETRGQHICTDR